MRKIRLTERRKLGGDCGGKKGQGPEGGTWCEGGNHRSGLYCSHVGYCKANPGDMITTSTGGGKTKYPKEASKYITIKESDLINIIRRMINELDEPRPTDLDHYPPGTHGPDDKGSARRGPTTKKQKMAPTPAPPAAAPPCTGLGNTPPTTTLGQGCCGKCDNLPNPFGPFTPAELTYLGVCAQHCPCC